MSAEDIVLIQQLVCREREGRDRQWWDEMKTAYAEDSWIDLSWYQGNAKGFIEGSIQMAKAGTTSKHSLGPVVVRVSEDGRRALATVSATIESRLEINGVEADVMSDTRLLYRVRKSGVGGTWKLISLDCIYESDRMVPALPGESISIDSAELKRHRSSYRCLSFLLEKKGLSVNGDLAGDDRPEQVQKLYDDAFQWLKSDASHH